jgi:hypothetical protein
MAKMALENSGVISNNVAAEMAWRNGVMNISNGRKKSA